MENLHLEIRFAPWVDVRLSEVCWCVTVPYIMTLLYFHLIHYFHVSVHLVYFFLLTYDPKPRSFKNTVNGCPHPDQPMLLLSCMSQVYHVTESRERSFFSPSSSHQLLWLSPKDALSLPQGAVDLDSVL